MKAIEEHQTIRCKFICSSVKENYLVSGSNWEYEFYAVYSGSEENKKFWKATPSGNLKFGSMNGPFFQVGSEYYLDISKAYEPAMSA